ncbi:MAG: hypothetical protein ACOC2J_01200 [bacterium]
MDKTRVYLTESLSSKEKKKKEKGSLLSIIIMIIGYIIIFGGIATAGYLIFFIADYGILRISLLCLACVFSGVLIIGFGKVIKLLEEISRKTELK